MRGGLLPVATLLWAAGATLAHADGATAYLPINLEPEMERQIERVLILADEPILKRPFAVELVKDALPAACRVDAALCHRVDRYLERYSRDYAVTHASATGTLTHGKDKTGVVPNDYGMPIDDKWQLSAQGYVQPNDYLIASVGGVAYSGRTVPVGSLLSFGDHYAQVDIGYRNHWWSPMTDSSSLMSTEAPTLPSVTLSNYEPLTRLGLQYELFLARMTPNLLAYDGKEATGNPHLFGLQLSIEPFPGWSVGVNRLLQYGGGDGLPDSAKFLLRDFFRPGGQSQNQGNQEASYVSRFIFPAKVPFAVYFQYAGENTEDGGSYLLGNSALSAGIDFPTLGKYFDVTYEFSEWQNTWYANFIFLNGMTTDGLVDGNWGADQRQPDSGVGARSQMLRVGWEPSFGGYLEERVRTLVNQQYVAVAEQREYSPGGVPFAYHHYLDFTLRYSRPWNAAVVGGELLTGQDVFGQKFTRLSGFVRYGGDARTRQDENPGSDDAIGAETGLTSDVHGLERFVDIGVNASVVHANLQEREPIESTKTGIDPHLAIGARREVAPDNDLGVRLEADQVHGHNLIGVRAVDYRYRFDNPLAVGLFIGVARYDLATPAYSIYYGGGAQWRDILPKWDLGLEYRHDQNLARDHLLPSDPPGLRPDSFYKIDGELLFVSRRF
jgi:hypothetical protein